LLSHSSRRAFLQLLCSGAASAAFPASISRALAIPAHNKTGTIRDVEHIVFMMQENRSFDHYFGTLRGVRGFGDPRAVRLPSGKSVFHQPHGDGHLLPFHPGAANLGLQFLEDLPHDWTSTHAACNGGHYDQWVPNKGPTTMAHLTRSDIPYHYALADAFTICDAYHCSLLGPTDPNRYHMWSGWVGNDGSGGGPVIGNEEAGYGWSTYPEVLQQAGINWKVYQDIGLGLDATGKWGDTDDAYIGNYGDNALLYFSKYQEARPGDPLHDRAKTGTQALSGDSLFDPFRKDVASGNLPQVSWVVAPEAYTEHPNWPANYGAWYVSQILDALTANPEVWSKTVFFLMYDENDGFFDHMVPPMPPASRKQGLSTIDTVQEIYSGDAKAPSGPYGLGVRVPMVVISPWSKGGWVSSQVFDHTSLIRFIERRFSSEYPGINSTNITPWRRAVAGDLTSAFNFATPNNGRVHLPHTASYAPPDNKRYSDYVPKPPVEQALPTQEKGTRPARAVPYELHVESELTQSGHALALHLRNTGAAAAVFQVRDSTGQHSPRSYTVGAGEKLSDTWELSADGLSAYELLVYGPNGFFRSFKGSGGDSVLRCHVDYDIGQGGILLKLTNTDRSTCYVHLADAYTGQTHAIALHAGKTNRQFVLLSQNHGWYDLTIETDASPAFQQRFAGHLENGQDSLSDPAIAQPSLTT
jgi:phospholipase C